MIETHNQGWMNKGGKIPPKKHVWWKNHGVPPNGDKEGNDHSYKCAAHPQTTPGLILSSHGFLFGERFEILLDVGKLKTKSSEYQHVKLNRERCGTESQHLHMRVQGLRRLDA